MKKYDMISLEDPNTYEKDAELTTAAKKAATLYFAEIFQGKMSRGDAKKAVLSGKYPEMMHRYIKEHCIVDLHKSEKETIAKENLEIFEKIIPPENFKIEIEDDEILILGSYDRDLAKRISRKNGFWDGKNHTDRQCLVLPLSEIRSLDRIFKNWEKKRKKLETDLDTEQNSRNKKEFIKRREEQKMQEDQTIRRMISRVKIDAKSYAVGDHIDGKIIDSFGKTWLESVEPNPKEIFGSRGVVQLWENCSCGHEPVYAPAEITFMGEQKCLSCWATELGKSIEKKEVCYAYFE